MRSWSFLNKDMCSLLAGLATCIGGGFALLQVSKSLINVTSAECLTRQGMYNTPLLAAYAVMPKCVLMASEWLACGCLDSAEDVACDAYVILCHMKQRRSQQQ